jgi:carboxyl-terminal processing protease
MKQLSIASSAVYRASFGIVSLVCFQSQAEVTNPTGIERQISKVVAVIMERDHVSSAKIDERLSQRAWDILLERLDPRKECLLRSDLDELKEQRNKFALALSKDGNVGAAFELYRLFEKRMKTRADICGELLKGEFDFSVNESLAIDYANLHFPLDEDEARTRWRKRLKYELLLMKGGGFTDGGAKELVRNHQNAIHKQWQDLTNDDLLKLALSSFCQAFDEQSSYMSPSTLTDFFQTVSSHLPGIGVALKRFRGQHVVSRVLPGGSADQEGQLGIGDRVVAIKAEEGRQFLLVDELFLDSVVRMLRGETDSRVSLLVLRPGTRRLRRIDFVRDDSPTMPVTSVIVDVPRNEAKPALKIGLVNIPSFYARIPSGDGNDSKNTSKVLTSILNDFTDKKVDAVIIDLRMNEGGLLVEVIRCAGLFIGKGPILQLKDNKGQVSAHADEEAGTSWSGPLVVLTSSITTSGGELFAAALKDYGRALVVGDTTSRRGSVQSLLNLGAQLFRGIENPPNFGAMRVTLSEMYSPAGAPLTGVGAVPHLNLPTGLKQRFSRIKDGDSRERAEPSTIDSAEFVPVQKHSDTVLADIRRRFHQRVRTSQEFQKFIALLAQARTAEGSKLIPLSEKQFFEDSLADSVWPRVTSIDAKGDLIRDYYLNEVFRITADYCEALKR